MRRFIIAAATAATIGVVALTVSAPPTAAVDLAATQAAHFAVVDRIAQVDAESGAAQMGDVKGDPNAGWIEFGWAGDVPAAARDIAAEVASEGIDVRFSEVPVSTQDATELAQAVVASLPADGPFGVLVDATGVKVEVPTAEAAAEAGVPAIPLDDPAVQDAIEIAEADAGQLGLNVTVEETDSVPVTTAAGVATAPLKLGPTNDTSVFSGGLRVKTQFRSGEYVKCTSGFPGVFGHKPMIVTAAHCSDYADGRAVQNDSGTRIGTSALVKRLNKGDYPTDLGIISLSFDARTLPRIYTSDSATLSLTYASANRIPAGYTLCSAGQATGWKCNLKSEGPYVMCYSSDQCLNLQRVQATSGQAFCFGDSGGPVVTPATSQRTTQPVGVVSGMRGEHPGGCGKQGLIAPVADFLRLTQGAQIHTVPGP